MSTTCPARWGKPRRRELSPLPPLMIYQAAQLMDSFEKLNILAGIMTSAAEIKEGQKTFASPEEKQQAQMDEQHAKVMRLFSAIAKALNAGYVKGGEILGHVAEQNCTSRCSCSAIMSALLASINVTRLWVSQERSVGVRAVRSRCRQGRRQNGPRRPSGSA